MSSLASLAPSGHSAKPCQPGLLPAESESFHHTDPNLSMSPSFLHKNSVHNVSSARTISPSDYLSHLSTNITSLARAVFMGIQPAQLHGTSHLIECSVVGTLKFLIILKQEAPRFYFSLAPAIYVASPTLGEAFPNSSNASSESLIALHACPFVLPVTINIFTPIWVCWLWWFIFPNRQ